MVARREGVRSVLPAIVASLEGRQQTLLPPVARSASAESIRLLLREELYV